MNGLDAQDLVPLRQRVAAFAATIDAALPPDLFAPVQGLTQPDDLVARQGFGLTWCCAADELISRFPALPHSQHEQYPDEIQCIDLMVDVTTDGAVSRVELEMYDVAETLREVGRLDLEPEAQGLVGQRVDEVGSRLTPLLMAIFERTDVE